MKASDIPLRLPIPWGASAGGTEIRVVPQTSQVGIQDGAASWPTGFPPLNFQPIAAGGVRPFGQDVNGGLNAISAWTRWQGAGGAVPWDSAFSTAVGGYPAGAVVAAAVFGYLWLSLVDDNTSNPDAGGANWAPISPLGGFTTGDAKITFKPTADPGWIIPNDGSIGDASSGATTLANASTAALFALEWGIISNSFAQVQDSSGTPVARGVSAVADFAAHRRILVPKQLGRALMIAGSGSGLSFRALGDGTIGAEANAILQANLPALTLNTAIASGQGSHSHSMTGAVVNSGNINVASGGLAVFGFPANSVSATNASTLPAMTGTTPTGGSGTPLSVMQPSTAWNIMIKL